MKSSQYAKNPILSSPPYATVPPPQPPQQHQRVPVIAPCSIKTLYTVDGHCFESMTGAYRMQLFSFLLKHSEVRDEHECSSVVNALLNNAEEIQEVLSNYSDLTKNSEL